MPTLPRLALVLSLLGIIPLHADTPEKSGAWINLLSSPTLADWERLPPAPGPKYALVEKSPWSLDPKTGILSCNATGLYEMFLYRTPLPNGVFHVEWRYVGQSEKPDGGILVRATDNVDRWLQMQLAIPGLGSISNKVAAPDKDKKLPGTGKRRPELIRPPGEWNVMQITLDGPSITLVFNGETTAEIPNFSFPDGRVGLQAEFTPIEFRNVRFKTP